MKSKTNYFKIGLFTALSVGLVIIFLLFLGIGKMFQPHQLAETYFDESIQGLNIGSPVKYRGVTVGKVTKISMINEIYGTEDHPISMQEQRYIYVQFSLSPQLPIPRKNQQDVEETVKNYVKNGMRASLATQDLVGNVFLSLNFVEENDSETLPISWTPETPYIPSTPSTLSQLTDSVSNIASQLNNINFEKVVNDFDDLTLSMNKSIKELQVDQLGKKLKDALDNTSSAMEQINMLSSKMSQYTASQQKIWETTFSALQQMSTNLVSVSNTLKNNPSAVVFGQPAKPVDPSL